MTVSTPVGQVLRDDEGVRLEFRRTFDHPVQDVWEVLTEPERVARWIGTLTGDPATGSVELLMSEEEGASSEPVRILECTRASQLVLDLPSPDGTWRVSVELEATGDETTGQGSTTLLFTQRLVEPFDASSIGPGWHYYLDRLGAVVAGSPVPDDWDDYYPALQSAYALPD